jgi:hypothetical protein
MDGLQPGFFTSKSEAAKGAGRKETSIDTIRRTFIIIPLR